LKILLVDDDPDMLDVTKYGLHKRGYEVVTVSDGAEALRRCESDNPDLVLLDVGLPRVNGFEVLRKLRETSRLPVIILSGRSDEEQLAQGFVLGADDYVTKPFSHRLLAMRVNAVLQRSSGRLAAVPDGQMTTRTLSLDLQAHEVKRGDVRVRLTPLEFRILHILAANEGRVVTTSRLVQHAWGHDAAQTALLKTHVCHIRRKLHMRAGEPGYIKAVPWVGYYLTKEAESRPTDD
jgi:DNA-binding response OmpR family regulator